MIFEEFTQVPSALQRRVKGTGLGLPLCRKLATLLGGDVSLESEPGKGSTFSTRIPLRFLGAPMSAPRAPRNAELALPPDAAWVLIVEDDEGTRMIYERFLRGSRFTPFSVASLAQARGMLRAHRPMAVILDILLPGEEHQTWRWLAEEKSGDTPIPVIVVSASSDGRKALSLGADAYFDKPLAREALVAKLDELSDGHARGHLALIIDDDAAARYVIRRSVRGPMRFEEAADGAAGLAAAASMRPEVIFLDLSMPGMNGSEVLERLAADPGTSDIPVVIVTSHDVDEELRTRLSPHARAIVHKRDLSVESLAATLAAIQRGAAQP